MHSINDCVFCVLENLCFREFVSKTFLYILCIIWWIIFDYIYWIIFVNPFMESYIFVNLICHLFVIPFLGTIFVSLWVLNYFCKSHFWIIFVSWFLWVMKLTKVIHKNDTQKWLTKITHKNDWLTKITLKNDSHKWYIK